MSFAPNPTIYVNNLNEKIKLPELKSALFELFTQHGEILDIVAGTSVAKRGQAFVVFREQATATACIKALQKYMFFEKPLKLAFARSKSDATAMNEGNFQPRLRKDLDKKGGKEQMKGIKRSGDVFKQMPEGTEAPNKTLYATGLPAEMTENMLQVLFNQYAGFKEARYVAARQVAFIEFEDDMKAGTALHGLRGFKLDDTHALNLSYARR